jgi:glycosyltransferase involved in cell wall biosynthesis
MTASSSRQRIRLLAIMEGSTVSGPAKNLFEFCRISRALEDGPIVETSLVVFERPNPATGALPASNDLIEQATQDGIPVHRIAERFAFDRRVMGTLKQVVDQVAPDILQTHMFKSHFLVRACGAHTGRAWVAFHHGYTRSTLKRDLLAQLDRWSLRTPTQVVTVSQAFSRQLASHGVPSHRIMVLHNAIDSGWLSQQPQGQDPALSEVPAKSSQAEKLLLAVGRLSKEKGFIDLIAAVRHLKQTRPDLPVRLVIVGDGLERAHLEEAVRSHSLQEQVFIMGHVRDVRPYYRAADLLAISSLSEGSPNALLEAMAAGVPVVSTAVGGIPEIVTHRESAFLVSPRNPVALAQAMEQVLSDQVLAQHMANRARHVVHTQYSPLSRVKTLVSLYQRICLSSGVTPRTEPRAVDVSRSIPAADGGNGRSLNLIQSNLAQPNESHKF